MAAADLDTNQLLVDLIRDEAFVPFIYDDATDEKVVPGYVMKGNATLCTGWCPARNPCTPDLNVTITTYWMDKSNAALFASIPWLTDQPASVQLALCNMAFNLGVHGLMSFNTFIALVQTGQYIEAADDLGGTAWFEQVGARGPRIQQLIREGAT